VITKLSGVKRMIAVLRKEVAVTTLMHERGDDEHERDGIALTSASQQFGRV
jgi:hypothetical protein